jgi:amidase
MESLGDVFLATPAAAVVIHITVPGKVYDLPVGFSFFEISILSPKLIGIACL